MVITEGVLREAVVIDACNRMDRKSAAKALRKSAQTLANWAVQGRGPKPFMVDGRAYYWADEVIAYGRGESQAA